MNNIIEIKDLSFKYEESFIFENLNFNIEKNSFITILGKASSGKTTLGKIMCGIIKTKSLKSYANKQVYINNLLEENLSVIELFMLNQNNKEYIDFISKIIKIEKLASYKISSLSSGEKVLVTLAHALIKKPDLLVIDNIISILDKIEQDRILKILKKINSELDITIINITTNSSEALYSKKTLILNNELNYDLSINILKNEKLLKSNNIEIPFMISLSNKLKYYDLLEDIILDIDKMVNKLWQ